MDKTDVVVIGFLLLIASFGIGVNLADYSAPEGLITYHQQEEDKHLCERDIKRSEQCVPIIMWLPEAESEVGVR